MDIETIIQSSQKDGIIPKDFIEKLDNDHAFRVELIDFFKQNKNREFALLILHELSLQREKSTTKISGDNLMLACYLVGLHGHVEDCLKIWNTKIIDFDTYCYIDIQLVPFAGVEKTISYLKLQTSKEATSALEYVLACEQTGDFTDLENYYSPLPWFI